MPPVPSRRGGGELQAHRPTVPDAGLADDRAGHASGPGGTTVSVTHPATCQTPSARALRPWRGPSPPRRAVHVPCAFHPSPRESGRDREGGRKRPRPHLDCRRGRPDRHPRKARSGVQECRASRPYRVRVRVVAAPPGGLHGWLECASGRLLRGGSHVRLRAIRAGCPRRHRRASSAAGTRTPSATNPPPRMRNLWPGAHRGSFAVSLSSDHAPSSARRLSARSDTPAADFCGDSKRPQPPSTGSRRSAY